MINQKSNWFTQQLELAAEECRKLPDWARREAGLSVPARPAATDRSETSETGIDSRSPAPDTTQPQV